MDVRCERCRAQYAVDDARVSEAGVAVACTHCGHPFLLKKKVLAVTVPLKATDAGAAVPLGDLVASASAGSDVGPESAPGGAAPGRGEWRLRRAGGAVYPFRELSTLQRWIAERKATRSDEVAPAGQEAWRRLDEVPELQSFFVLVDRAEKRAEPASHPEPAAAAPPPGPASDDPAWARGPVAPARRITRPSLRAARPRPRAVWVALIAVALVALAAGTILLRHRANDDVAAEALAASRQATPPAPAQKPAPPPGPAPAAVPPAHEPPVPAKPAATTPAAAPEAQPAPAPASRPAGSDAAPAPAPAPADAGSPAPSGPAAATPADAGATAPERATTTVEDPAGTAAAPARGTPAPAPARSEPPGRAAARNDPTAQLRTVLARAREQRDRGRCESALDLYGQALALDGRNAAALAGRGACYLDLSRYVQAEASFEAALDSDPRNAEALYGLAETYRYMGRKADAVAFYERFLAVRPNGDEAAAARRLVSQLKE